MKRHTRYTIHRFCPLVGLAAVALVSLGCQRESAIVDGPHYPEKPQRAGVVDVQVTRDGSTISLTNTTANTLGPGRLWVNSWYSIGFPALAIGQTRTLDLYDFQDRYGTAFRGGGFFASERSDRVALVELESPIAESAGESGGSGQAQMLGMVVVKGDE